MSFKLPYDLLCFDVESNQPSGLIIEIGATKISREGAIGETFSTLVKIPEKLGLCIGRTETITELTGINDEMLSYAQSFEDALKQFHTWANKETSNVILASWGNYDIIELKNNCSYYGLDFPFKHKLFELKTACTLLTSLFGGKIKTDGLTKMLEINNLQWDYKHGKQHRGLADAYNTAILFTSLLKKYKTANININTELSNIGIK